MDAIRKFFRAPLPSKLTVILYDALLGGLCMYLVILWRFTLEPEGYPPAGIAESATFVFVLSVIASWILTDAHKAIWRFISLDDIKNIFQGVVLATIIAPVILFFSFRADGFPRSVPFIAGSLFFFLLVLSRMVVLFIRNGDVRAIFRGQNQNQPNAVLVGDETSLHNYLRDVSRKAMGPGYNIKGLIGTDADHRGRSIRGIPILGNIEELPEVYSELKKRYTNPPTLIAADENPGRTKSYNLVRKASELGAPLVRVSASRPDTLSPFEAADLIGRELKALDIDPVRRFISGKRVLITGAGGTIGSEITRQIAALEPERLILVDNSEFNLYEIDRELKNLMPDAKNLWFPFLANICDKHHLDEIFEKEKPEIILHAAALKHVPLSEINPIEALRTNIGGTKTIIDLAIKNNAESFTLISTDKAVRPSNIMGASKRVAEMLTMCETRDNELSACAVRFGNVLASTGSVVPLFEEQIAKGGPVTVTDKDVTRYFMTTEEAAALVLQAAALNLTERPELGSIYVLEMGEPVKINKLARQLIRLRGLVPDRDIQIVYTGLRPGEKLREELMHDDEEFLESTYVDGVMRFTGGINQFDKIRNGITELIQHVGTRDRETVKKSLAKILPDYKPNGTLAPESPFPDNVTKLHAKSKP